MLCYVMLCWRCIFDNVSKVKLVHHVSRITYHVSTDPPLKFIGESLFVVRC